MPVTSLLATICARWNAAKFPTVGDVVDAGWDWLGCRRSCMCAEATGEAMLLVTPQGRVG